MLSKHRILSTREKDLVALRDQHKKLLKKVQASSKKLDKLKEEIVVSNKAAATVVLTKMQAIQELQKSVHELFEQCIASKIFTKKERKTLKDLKAGHEDTFDGMNLPPMSEEEMNRFFRQQSEEQWKEFFAQADQRFAAKVSPEEQRSIREVFKRLAAKFHPDKAAGDAALERRLHSLMQRINQAYQRADIADLLAIEAEFANLPDILAQEHSVLADIVETEIARINREIALCDDQLKRLKAERTELQQSQEGVLHKDFQHAQKVGLDPITEIAHDFDEAIEELTYQKTMLEKTLKGEIGKEELMKDIEENSHDIPQNEQELLDLLFALEDMMAFDAPPKRNQYARPSKPKRK